MPTTISGTSGVTFPAGGTGNPAGTVVGTTDTQTLTNKTLTTPTVATIKSAASATPTVFQDSAGTEVGTLCRAWVNFDGTTGTRRGNFNVSSVTRTTTATYVVNFTNAMPDTNYSAVGMSGITSGTGATYSYIVYEAISSGQVMSRTTSSIYINVTSGASSGDSYDVNVAVFR